MGRVVTLPVRFFALLQVLYMRKRGALCLCDVCIKAELFTVEEKSDAYFLEAVREIRSDYSATPDDVGDDPA